MAKTIECCRNCIWFRPEANTTVSIISPAVINSNFSRKLAIGEIQDQLGGTTQGPTYGHCEAEYEGIPFNFGLLSDSSCKALIEGKKMFKKS